MAIFNFLRKGKKEKDEKLGGIQPPPKPKIEEIPSFPFEKEELLPPIKPFEHKLQHFKEEPEEEPEEAPEEGLEKFIPRPPPPVPGKEKPRPAGIMEEGVAEKPIFEGEVFEREAEFEREIEPETSAIKPQTSAIMPVRSDFAPKMAEAKQGVPFVRIHKFREAVADMNHIAKSLRKIPARIKSRDVDDAYESFEKSLDTIMKNIDSIERSIFE